MPIGFQGSPPLVKGAFVELPPAFIGPVPKVIAFQYNPETISRTLSTWLEKGTSDSAKAHADTAQPEDPGETFNFKLELDATDALEFPEQHPVSARVGVADRIAALEALIHPVLDEGVMGANGGLGGGWKGKSSGAGNADESKKCKVPVVLFVWGPGRIVPVRITSFSVDEKAFSRHLYPILAEVTIGLKVLKPASFGAEDKRTPSEELAVSAYNWTSDQKFALAHASAANNVDAILGMLPF